MLCDDASGRVGGGHRGGWSRGLARRAVAAGVIGLGVGAVGGLSGCTSYTPAGTWWDRRTDTEAALPRATGADLDPIPLAADAWPERTSEGIEEAVARGVGVIRRGELDGTRAEAEVDAGVLSRVREPLGEVTYVGRHGVGIVRAVRVPDRDRPTVPAAGERAGAGRVTEEMLRFVSFSKVADRPQDRRVRRYARWLSMSARANVPGVRMTDARVLASLYEGTGVRIIPPSEEARQAHPHAGVLLHMPGLNSLQYEQPVLDTLSGRGWTIVRVSTPSLWWLQDTRIAVSDEGEIGPAAGRVARLVDDLLAEPAYAAEATLEYLDQTRPDLAGKPLVLLGMSAGALMMPTVAARISDRVSAMVLVGGGANLLDISQRSELTDGGLKLTLAPEMDRRKTLAALSAAYLEQSRLDPYHAAAAVRDVPTLLVLAGMDTIVPADSGRLLWERLGRPERYTFSMGHALMFWSLSSQTQRIVTWVDRVADPKPKWPNSK